MPEKPKLTPVELDVLQKAKEAADSGTEIRLTGAEAKMADKLMLGGQPHSWGGDQWGPHHPHWPHHPWGNGPYINGWHDGNDIVLGGITSAGLMVLDSILHPQPQVVVAPPPEPEPAPPAPVTVNVNVPPSGGRGRYVPEPDVPPSGGRGRYVPEPDDDASEGGADG